MEIISGGLVCMSLLLLGVVMDAPILVAAFSSLAFGSTAIASTGGSTVPVFVALAALLIVATACSSQFASDLKSVVMGQPLARLAALITAYAVATAFVYPRLLADLTIVVVPVRSEYLYVTLQPVPGNVNQAIYYALDGLALLTIGVLLRRGLQAKVRLAFLAWASTNAALGMVDVAGRMVGLGDVLSPIRNAGYAMLTEQSVGGFVRILGGFPEASAFACAGVPAFAFALVDWHSTGARYSLLLAACLGLLLLFSTSSTAYGGLGVLVIVYGFSTLVSLLRGRLFVHEILFLSGIATGAAALLAIYLYDAHVLDPLINLILNATVNCSATIKMRGQRQSG